MSVAEDPKTSEYLGIGISQKGLKRSKSVVGYWPWRHRSVGGVVSLSR